MSGGIGEWVRFWGRYDPAGVAVLWGEERHTWADLARCVRSLARGLRDAGVQIGDRVAVLAPNCPEFVHAVFATADAGGIFVPHNPRLTEDELSYARRHCDPRVLIVHPSLRELADAVASAAAATERFDLGPERPGSRSYAALAATAAPADDEVTVSGDQPVLLMFTSGTTGYPKAALLSHANVSAIAQASTACDALRPGDRMVLGMPLAFTGALVTQCLPIVAAGCSMVLRDSMDGDTLLDDIERHGVTYAYGVPLFYERIASSARFSSADLSTWRGAKSGGAPVPQAVLQTFNARGVTMVSAYGLTEAGGFNLQLHGSRALDKLGSVGVPVPGMRAKVVDAAGRDVGTGEVGELLLSGPSVMIGYWRDPEATAAVLRDGWLSTGDQAVVDEDGFFSIVGRKNDMLISGGLNVYPAEVERVLAAHPDVTAVAVVGAPDERWGEMPVAFVVAQRPELTLEELRHHCTGLLADYKRPRRLVLVDELPLTLSGKVRKAALRTWALST